MKQDTLKWPDDFENYSCHYYDLTSFCLSLLQRQKIRPFNITPL
jgi:hypothetical protein